MEVVRADRPRTSSQVECSFTVPGRGLSKGVVQRHMGWQLGSGVSQLIQLNQQLSVWFVQIASFKHLAIEVNHLVNVNGIVPADLGPDVVNPALVLLLSR